MIALAELPRPAPAPVVDREPRCWRCGKLLLRYAARPWACECGRCRARNSSEPER